jgi:hypothetical protein
MPLLGSSCSSFNFYAFSFLAEKNLFFLARRVLRKIINMFYQTWGKIKKINVLLFTQTMCEIKIARRYVTFA